MTEQWRRHPADVARLVMSSLVLVALLGLVLAVPDTIRDLSADLALTLRRLPVVVRELVLGVSQLTAIVGPPVVAGILVAHRRFRLLGTTVVGVALAGVAMVLLQGWLDRTVPPSYVEAGTATSWITGASFPSGTYLAGLTAAVVILGSASNRSWRRAGWAIVAVVALLRLASTVSVPLNLAVTLAVGAAASSLVLVLLGAPVRRVQTEAVLAAVRQLGVEATGIEELDVGATHSRTFRLSGPTPAFVKLIGRDERSAEWLMRAVRLLRVRGLDDDRPGWSPTQVARHEALANLLAAQAGVAVAPVLAVGATPEGDGLTVQALVPGRRLVDLDPAEIDGALLRTTFAQLRALHRSRLAHRWFDAGHVIVDDQGRPTVVDLRWAVIGADDQTLALDVADLVTSLSLLVGADVVAEAAAEVLGPAALAAAVPLTQPLVLSPPIRATLKGRPELMGEVRAAMTRAAGIDDYELAQLQRVTLGRAVGWVGTAVITYLALAFASNWSSVTDAFRTADFSYVPTMLALTVVGTVGGALSLMGSVPRPLPFLATVEVMYAQSFLNRFTPANAGGMALRVRYLQSHGADLPAAAASVGITSAASGVLQLGLLAMFALWAGRSDELAFDLPGASTVAIVLFVVLALGGLVMVSARVRGLVFGSLIPSVRRAWDDLSELARDPAKLGLLFGGALMAKLAVIAAFVLSTRAFGVDESFARLALLYMTANTVASAAPTPGGVGAIEAALVAVLTGMGVDAAEALSIVVVFRVVTYWVPVVPAWWCLTRVRRQVTV